MSVWSLFSPKTRNALETHLCRKYQGHNVYQVYFNNTDHGSGDVVWQTPIKAKRQTVIKDVIKALTTANIKIYDQCDAKDGRYTTHWLLTSEGPLRVCILRRGGIGVLPADNRDLGLAIGNQITQSISNNIADLKIRERALAKLTANERLILGV
jgi:hypothetical protein